MEYEQVVSHHESTEKLQHHRFGHNYNQHINDFLFKSEKRKQKQKLFIFEVEMILSKEIIKKYCGNYEKLRNLADKLRNSEKSEKKEVKSSLLKFDRVMKDAHERCSSAMEK